MKLAYVHCHNCNFSQDDFWDKSYNPVRFLLNVEKTLLTMPLDEVPDWNEEGHTWREWFALQLERKAEAIRTMKYRTHEEFIAANPDLICPQCQQKALDID